MRRPAILPASLRSIGAAAAVLLCATAVRAGAPEPEPRDEAKSTVLDAPAPPTLPALAHRDLTFTFEYTAAVIQTKSHDLLPAPDPSGDAFAYFAHTNVEYPVVPREWFVALANDLASAAVPGVGTAFLLGNPELSGRGVWSSTRGLSSGGGLGVVLPVPRTLSPVEEEVLRTVRTVRPWDLASFSSLQLTIRPWIDIRHVTGGLIFQLRQALDWSIDLAAVDKAANGVKSPTGETYSGAGPRLTDFTARLTFYMGYRLSDAIGVGVELWEIYEITKDLPNDDKRATFALSPSIRFMLPRVQPAVSFLFPLATPLRGDVASYFAARFNIGFNFDVRPGKTDVKNAMRIE